MFETGFTRFAGISLTIHDVGQLAFSGTTPIIVGYRIGQDPSGEWTSQLTSTDHLFHCFSLDPNNMNWIQSPNKPRHDQPPPARTLGEMSAIAVINRTGDVDASKEHKSMARPSWQISCR